MHKASTTRWLVLLGLLLAPLGAGAQEGRSNEALVCRPDVPELDKYAYLRALSLDLRGMPPTAEEYAALDAEQDVPDSAIDAYLASPEFVTRVVRWHREMLWNNISNISTSSFRAALGRTTDGTWWRRAEAFNYRGVETPCLNEPATFNPDGSPVTRMVAGARVEGYVTVHPYWAPERSMNVCAFDAQAALVSPTGTDCSQSAGYNDVACGCGPDLRWCRADDVNKTITDSMAQDVERRIAAMVQEDRPYTELFTSRRAFVNGPLVHFWKHHTGVPDQIKFTPVPLHVDRLPDLAFTQKDTWVEIELPEGHAGILTAPAYLARFQTNRARANRVFNAFLCQPFTPPAGGIPPGTPAQMKIMDLQERHGCKYCHNILEPSAAYWGRWTERSTGYLSPEDYPPLRQDCLTCARTGQGCSNDCRTNYVTQMSSEEQRPYLGMLNALQFRREDHIINVAMGPQLLMESGVVDNRLPACLAKTAGEKLMGRALVGDELDWVRDDVARTLVQSNYSYRTMVKQLVTSHVYRRVR